MAKMCLLGYISAILERKIIAYFYFNKKDQNVGWAVKRLTTRDVSQSFTVTIPIQQVYIVGSLIIHISNCVQCDKRRDILFLTIFTNLNIKF